MVSKYSVSTLVTIGLMTALICIFSPFSIPLWFSPVPLTFSTFALYLAAIVLGAKKGTVCCFLYLLLGMTGLPVFSGFSGGIHRLLGPTGGYLIGYLLLVAISGLFIDKWYSKWLICLLGMLSGTIACYLFGTLWLSYQMQVSFTHALYLGVCPYLLPDIIKILLALLVGRQLRQRVGRQASVTY